MRIAAVITAFNEGEEVRKTVESLAGSINHHDTTFEAIVVDDGSKDGSCQDSSLLTTDYSLLTIRHDVPEGVGRSRNAGVVAALAAGADVVTFHDAHMRFPDGVIEALARKAIESGAIVTSKALGWWDKDGKEHSFRAWGADMHWNLRNCLEPKYRIYVGEQPEWIRVPCPMGACYVMSRETIEKLSAPTGRLWDDVAGRWGFSEQALAVKAFLLDIPVLVSRDLATHHHYKGTNPVPNANIETVKNACFSMAALLSEQTFNGRFRRYCEVYLGPEQTTSIYKEARKAGIQETDKNKEAGIFTHLCGRGAPITEPHPDHAWLAELTTHCSLLTTHSPFRVLQWRPGESTLLLKQLCPDAQIKCLEWENHRATNWGPILKDVPNVNLLRIALANWADPVASGHIKADERFDLITIGGEMQDECRPAAERLLAPGGRIVVNPTADRLQIEDKERRRAEKELETFKGGKRPGEHHEEHEELQDKIKNIEHLRALRDLRGSVTMLLLSWQRPENLGPILDCLAAQTARPRIILWNNGDPINISSPAGPPVPIENDPRMSLVVRPSQNMGCMPRWWLAALAETEFVCSLDDDLLLADNRVLEDAIKAQRELCPTGIVGFFGWEAVPGKNYLGAKHINGSSEDRRVDLIKGRFMLFQTRLLQRVLLAHPALNGSESCPQGHASVVSSQQSHSASSEQAAVNSEQSRPNATHHSLLTTHLSLLRRCDDIYINFCIGQGEHRPHLVPGVLGKRWKEHGEQDGRALALQPGHYEERDQMVNLMRNHYWGQEPRKGA